MIQVGCMQKIKDDGVSVSASGCLFYWNHESRRPLPVEQVLLLHGAGEMNHVAHMTVAHRAPQERKQRCSFALGFTAMVSLASSVYAAEPATTQGEDKQSLGQVMIMGWLERDDIERLPAIQGTEIFSGKKNEVINVTNLDANLAEKNPRQIFAKVPGVFVYDMDGTGNQVNIATRGLDPHRGWEFNIRKNGFITNSDMYGYPASHFSIPMEAIERMELVRGTGSLQYGAQFGGMLNYVTKRAKAEHGLSIESINSAGSHGLLSTYNALSGRYGATDFYADYSKRVSDGYREHSESDAQYYSLTIHQALTDTLKLEVEYARSKYLYQLPGPLMDAMFAANPRQATRHRNYYSPDIEVPAFGVEWTPSVQTTVTWKTSAIFGDRSSVLFDRTADVVDAVNPATGQYANRQVDIDNFHSRTSALKMLHRYTWAGREQALAIGVEAMRNDTHRRQQGVGTTASNYDLSLMQIGWGRDLHLKSHNLALFAENRFALTDRWSVNPGLRFESGASDMTGVIVGYVPEELPNKIKHRFTLLGVSTEYILTAASNLYAGYSQSYRPVIFKDIIPGSVLERVDKNLKDARGYTLEAGYRGDTENLRWDLSVFKLLYNNRMGTAAQFDGTSFYNLRTNVGDSRTYGVELFLQHGLNIGRTRWSLFTSTAWMDAEYQQAIVRIGQTNVSVSGNAVQSVPNLISRNGISMHAGPANVTLLYSYTAESYADALNTRNPSANGAVGLVPSYGLLDIAGSYRINAHLTLRANVNNFTDKNYFTKRPEFYPGPGVWPSDGRTASVSLGLVF